MLLEQLVRQHTPPAASPPAWGRQGLFSNHSSSHSHGLCGFALVLFPLWAVCALHLREISRIRVHRRSLDVFLKCNCGQNGSLSWLRHAKYLEMGQHDEHTMLSPLLITVARASAILPALKAWALCLHNYCLRVGRLLCGLLHPYMPVDQHTAVVNANKGVNSKAKQNSKGNAAVVCFSITGEGNRWHGEIKHFSSNSQNHPALRLQFNLSENELLGLTATRAWALPTAWAQLVAPTLIVQLHIYFYQLFRGWLKGAAQNSVKSIQWNAVKKCIFPLR